MRDLTRKLWAQQNRHPGDRERMFHAVAGHVDAGTVLYPGSYVDLAASFVWPSVTYADIDRRARRFFDDTEGVDEIIAEHRVEPADHTWRFVPGDYTDDLLGDLRGRGRRGVVRPADLPVRRADLRALHPLPASRRSATGELQSR